MENFIEVKCPCCKTILIVEKRTGKIVEERRPILENSTGDRFEDAFKKVKERSTVAEEKFRKMQEAQKSKQDRLNVLFKEKLKEAEESGDDVRPVNPYELD